MKLLPTREARRVLGLHPNTLRKYADEGKIHVVRTGGGKRLFDVDSFAGRPKRTSTICYCRVSSLKQKDDLARQVVYMREKFPNAEIITDIGSGLNFRRKGLTSILDRVVSGDKLTLVVAHKDRLARFGFELIEHLFKQAGGEVMVLDDSSASPSEELTKDILQILHVFSCRMHGLRRYCDEIKKDKNIPQSESKEIVS